MSDNPDNGRAEDEETTRHLFALLYPDEETSARVEVPAYADTEELSDFRSLLGHFREIPQEEPSAAVSNKLLALAAKHAPAAKKEESKGFFTRISDWLLPTVYHPGLASAATLVLVAGLAGTLYVNGKSQVAEPQVATQAERPNSAAPQAGSSVGNEALGTVRLADDPAEATGDSPADALGGKSDQATAKQELAAEEEPRAEVELDRATDDGLKLQTADSKEATDKSSAFKAGAKRDRSLDGIAGGIIGGEGGGGDGFASGSASSEAKNAKTKSAGPKQGDQKSIDNRARRKTPNAAKPEPVVSAPPAQPAPSKDKAAAPKPSPAGDSESSNKNSPGAAKPGPAPAADPTPAPPPPPSPDSVAEEKKPAAPVRGDSVGEGDDDDDAAEDEEEAPAQKPAESKVDPAARAAALHKKAVAAAKQNQCAKVKALGQEIRQLSSSYYDRTFLNDKKLTACLAPTVKK